MIEDEEEEEKKPLTQTNVRRKNLKSCLLSAIKRRKNPKHIVIISTTQKVDVCGRHQPRASPRYLYSSITIKQTNKQQQKSNSTERQINLNEIEIPIFHLIIIIIATMVVVMMTASPRGIARR